MRYKDYTETDAGQGSPCGQARHTFSCKGKQSHEGREAPAGRLGARSAVRESDPTRVEKYGHMFNCKVESPHGSAQMIFDFLSLIHTV